jgi:hypothetical protein
MNWISTKMPDGHWLTEARLKGTKVVTVACEYQSTSNKADKVIVMRPGSDPAFGLGLAHVIIEDDLLRRGVRPRAFTDLPLLVRMDTLKLLKPAGGHRRLPAGRVEEHAGAGRGGVGAAERPPGPAGRHRIAARRMGRFPGVGHARGTAARGHPRRRRRRRRRYALEGTFTVEPLDGQRSRSGRSST